MQEFYYNVRNVENSFFSYSQFLYKQRWNKRNHEVMFYHKKWKCFLQKKFFQYRWSVFPSFLKETFRTSIYLSTFQLSIINVECWNIEILKYWNIEILKYWNTEILKYWNIEILKYWNIEVSKHWNIRLFQLSAAYSSY